VQRELLPLVFLIPLVRYHTRVQRELIPLVFRFGIFMWSLIWPASLYIMLCTVSCVFVFNSSHPVTWTANYVKTWRDWRKFARIVVCDITGGKLLYVPDL
jgi:hypothetical protein